MNVVIRQQFFESFSFFIFFLNNLIYREKARFIRPEIEFRMSSCRHSPGSHMIIHLSSGLQADLFA
jgi:CRISPR/Cas system endoribonuclease Cas6 (RAMP superfamily)